jgi:hypothetical protein
MARRIITRLAPGLRSQTEELIEILADNQGVGKVQNDQGARPAGARAAAFDLKDSDFAMLKKSHQEWQGLYRIFQNSMNKAQWIAAASSSSSKKGRETRADVLSKAMESRYNFFVDTAHDDDHAVVLFSVCKH